ncbi:MAG: tetratricopeptide repeat protein [Anaerolineae bacterium]|nr:tetratricopeptide repeat protein [Anaerolineae bacterium]
MSNNERKHGKKMGIEKSRQANLAANQGDWEEAERLYLETLAEFETQDNRRQAAISKAYLGQVVIASKRRDEGCALLQEALEMLRQEPEAAYEISQVEMLIDERCGPFAWLTEDGAIQQLMETIAAFTAASNWDESRRLLDEHPELLSPQADKLFDAMIQYGSGEKQAQIIEQLTTHRDLLRLCRIIGVDDAFKQTVEPPGEP